MLVDFCTSSLRTVHYRTVALHKKILQEIGKKAVVAVVEVDMLVELVRVDKAVDTSGVDKAEIDTVDTAAVLERGVDWEHLQLVDTAQQLREAGREREWVPTVQSSSTCHTSCHHTQHH